MRIALALPSCPWIPERLAASERLKAALAPLPELTKEFKEQAPNPVWSSRMFEWLASTDSDWCSQIQEDCTVIPEFWTVLTAMLGELPAEADIVGLHVPHPLAPDMFEGGSHLFTTADGLVGVAWCMRTKTMREFVQWRKDKLRSGWDVHESGNPGVNLSEDTSINLFALDTGRKVFHPIPALVDHDVSLTSTYGNDHHQYRSATLRPQATEALKDPAFWRTRIPHLGRFYETTPVAAARWVAGFTESKYVRAILDDGRDEKRRMSLRNRMAAMDRQNREKSRVLICTPTRGKVEPVYNLAVWKAFLHAEVDVRNSWEIVDALQWYEDVCRVRNRFVRTFLDSDATHLWWLDDDNCVDPAVLTAMINTGYDFVACSYPRRDRINFEAVAKVDSRPPESRAYEYYFGMTEEMKRRPVDEKHCAEVSYIPLGCALMSRRMLEQMCERYAGELSYLDMVNERRRETVGLFNLMLRDRELYSEDRSFCARWRDMGGKVYMYFGPGSPVDHMGTHLYQGHIEAFGLRRIQNPKSV